MHTTFDPAWKSAHRGKRAAWGRVSGVDRTRAPEGPFPGQTTSAILQTGPSRTHCPGPRFGRKHTSAIPAAGNLPRAALTSVEVWALRPRGIAVLAPCEPELHQPRQITSGYLHAMVLDEGLSVQFVAAHDHPWGPRHVITREALYEIRFSRVPE